ncbi:hypothetical protein [Anaerosacchariphilus polymeriproducens]|uniref:Uncharacterized protein n=1 Tax=Anaerosacchariphilus polymeriproducens TaxID=1812858 RepID=A0A371AUI9_9FIRM|nr:hypothetical protein [Anaerosacchariphilus polymeriproducens]RDU23235.1 hypothetical protein DWV06_10685 [Anaerosacchariphilus polymeriproducens]
MAEWRFPSNDYGENKGINDSGVAMFRGTPLKSLAREICQNSLDAATDKKTVVEFSMFSIPSSQIPGRDYLLDTFKRCLNFWGGQKALATKEFFTIAINMISGDSCNILRISDFNTTGLTGSREEINTDWTNLTKSSGASDKKGTAGGSYGIGKFAPFACSAFSTVFYSTYDINDEKAMQGVSRLVTFTREDGQNTQGTGYYGNDRNTPVYEELKFEQSFSRKNGQYGTDIYIAGYKYGGENWQKDIIVSILDGFLGAIWNEKLEVKVGEIYICKSELGNIMEAYHDDLTSYTDKYYEVLISNETVWYAEDFLNLGELRLGLLLGNQDSPNRISMIRQTGMKIMDKDRLPGHVPFTGVMFIEGQKINERLRLIENPEHTKWEPERSKNPIQERQLLKALNDYIKSKIEELISSGAGESIDAVGVGNFIPDEITNTENQATEEVVSEKILDVEIKQIKKKSVSKQAPGSSESDSENEELGHKEKGGNDTEWFHDGGKTENPEHKPGQEAHVEFGGDTPMLTKINVGIEKFVCMGIDKDAGKYMLMVVPNQDGTNGELELYLSAETQRYEAPIKNANVIGGTAQFSKNVISGLTFSKGQPIRISLELDYFDYCSMEVMMHATSK